MEHFAMATAPTSPVLQSPLPCPVCSKHGTAHPLVFLPQYAIAPRLLKTPHGATAGVEEVGAVGGVSIPMETIGGAVMVMIPWSRFGLGRALRKYVRRESRVHGKRLGKASDWTTVVQQSWVSGGALM